MNDSVEILPTASFPHDKLLSDQRVHELLESDKTALRVIRKGLAPRSGDWVGVRLNLNIFKATGVPIQTLHQGSESRHQKQRGFYDGEALDYQQAVVLKNAYFNVSQEGRRAILAGEQNKFPMASIDGQFESANPPSDFVGIEVRFNPKSHHVFVDDQQQALRFAEEVVVFGHRAYARGRLEYYTEENLPQPLGGLPSEAKPVSSELAHRKVITVTAPAKTSVPSVPFRQAI